MSAKTLIFPAGLYEKCRKLM